jgi:uncharacterized Fe-S cluster-containing radical SAM superfamily enzyme
MKARLEPRINLDGRTALETVIPLATPFIVFVDPASSCNFKCTFCPTGHRDMIAETGRFQGVMKLDVFQKVIDDLGEFEKPIKVLRMYKDGEPFLNKRIADMVAYAKKSGHVDYIDTTTNGTFLSPDRVGPVLEAGIDKINISVDGMNEETYLRFTGFKFDFKNLSKTSSGSTPTKAIARSSSRFRPSSSPRRSARNSSTPSAITAIVSSLRTSRRAGRNSIWRRTPA